MQESETMVFNFNGTISEKIRSTMEVFDFPVGMFDDELRPSKDSVMCMLSWMQSAKLFQALLFGAYEDWTEADARVILQNDIQTPLKIADEALRESLQALHAQFRVRIKATAQGKLTAGLSSSLEKANTDCLGVVAFAESVAAGKVEGDAFAIVLDETTFKELDYGLSKLGYAALRKKVECTRKCGSWALAFSAVAKYKTDPPREVSEDMVSCTLAIHNAQATIERFKEINMNGLEEIGDSSHTAFSVAMDVGDVIDKMLGAGKDVIEPLVSAINGIMDSQATALTNMFPIIDIIMNKDLLKNQDHIDSVLNNPEHPKIAKQSVLVAATHGFLENHKDVFSKDVITKAG